MNIVDNKTMRGDHMIMIAVLSAASMLMLYYGSLMTPTEVYLPISPSTLRHSKPEVTTTTTTTTIHLNYVLMQIYVVRRKHQYVKLVTKVLVWKNT